MLPDRSHPKLQVGTHFDLLFRTHCLLQDLLSFFRMPVCRSDLMTGKPAFYGSTQHILTFMMPVCADACHIHQFVELGEAVDTEQILFIVRKIDSFRQFRDTAAAIKLSGLHIIEASPMRLSVLFHSHLCTINQIEAYGM